MDTAQYLRFVASLVFVLGLIFAGLWAIRRFGLFGPMMRPGGRRRLSVVETLAIDARHRLVLVRRDDREHLLLVGPTATHTVEAGIASGPLQGETAP